MQHLQQFKQLIDADLGVVLAVGCAFGSIFYLVACTAKRTAPDMRAIVMAILAGGGLVAGAHLLYCTFDPQHLVHLSKESDEHFDAHGIKVSLGMHTIDVFAGGAAVIFFSVGELISLWKKPKH